MRQIACGLLAAGLIATTTAAQAQELRQRHASSHRRAPWRPTSPAPARRRPRSAGAPSRATGQDHRRASIFRSLYFFRGIRQETDADFTFQPFVDVAFAASPTATLQRRHVEQLPHRQQQRRPDGGVLRDRLLCLGAFAAGNGHVDLLYTAYMSPADAFGTVHELTFTAAFTTARSLPAITLAFELSDKQADGGANKGIYLELAATPAIPMGDDAPVTLDGAGQVGLSLKDYYESPVTGEDTRSGTSAAASWRSVPLSPNLDIHGGVTFYAFRRRV